MKDSTILKPNLSDIGIFVISAITQQGSTNGLKGTIRANIILNTDNGNLSSSLFSQSLMRPMGKSSSTYLQRKISHLAKM